MKEIFTLGFYVTPAEKTGNLVSPAMAIFSSADFDPETWKPSFAVVPFENMTDEDAFWATRIILSFTEPELRDIIGTARYTNPKDAEYLLKTLLKRRSIIARHWMSKVNPIADFSVQRREGGVLLRFKDLMIAHGLDTADSADYVYQIESKHRILKKGSTRDPWIALSPSMLETLSGNGKSGTADVAVLLQVTIRTVRTGCDKDPVKIRLYNDPAQNRIRVVAVWRG